MGLARIPLDAAVCVCQPGAYCATCSAAGEPGVLQVRPPCHQKNGKETLKPLVSPIAESQDSGALCIRLMLRPTARRNRPVSSAQLVLS